jgi:hypothetical protein
VHRKNVIRRQIWHGLGQIDQGRDIADSVGIGIPGKRSSERRALVGLGGSRGRWAALSTGGAGCGLQGSMTGQGERRSLGLGSCFVSRSASGVRGATQGRKESPALRGKHRGVGGVFKWQSMPPIVSYNPVKDQE